MSVGLIYFGMMPLIVFLLLLSAHLYIESFDLTKDVKVGDISIITLLIVMWPLVMPATVLVAVVWLVVSSLNCIVKSLVEAIRK